MDRLRVLPLECPFWSSRVTLGRVRNGFVAFSNRVADKRRELAYLSDPRSDDVLLFAAWTGAYSTDLFRVTPEDAARLLAEKASPRG